MQKVIFLVCFFYVSFLYSQDEEAGSESRQFKGGLIAGIVSSQVDGDGYGGFNKAGPCAGAYVRSDINKKFDWRFEIIYNQKGSRKNPNPSKNDYSQYLLRLNYIDVPFVIRYKMKKMKLELGASAGVLFSHFEKNQYGEVPQLYPFKRYDAMLIAGLYYNFTDKLNINLRRSYSVLPVRKFDYPMYYPTFMGNFFNKGYYNNLLSLNLNYEF